MTSGNFLKGMECNFNIEQVAKLTKSEFVWIYLAI